MPKVPRNFRLDENLLLRATAAADAQGVPLTKFIENAMRGLLGEWDARDALEDRVASLEAQVEDLDQRMREDLERRMHAIEELAHRSGY